ncbi:MAG: N-acetylmuramoyl-L-alanine amidase [Prevotella sp.]|nr:N-acetylmuramoyl-L-alanine amidase [Prevotella sp.]
MSKIYFPKLTPDSTSVINGVTVHKHLLVDHNLNKITLPPMRTKPLIGITMHNTNDLPRVEDDGEQYTRATLNGNMGTVRTQYYTDELCGWQNLEDGRCNWTCADGSGSGNMQTIAIECIMSGTSGADNLKARDNAARLAAYLLRKNGLTADNLYTHTYWLHVRDGHTKLSDTANADKWCVAPHTYKNCPLYIIPDWIGFKKLVDGYVKQLGGSSVVAGGTFLVRVLDPALNIRAQPSLTAKINGVIRGKGAYTIVATSFEPKTQITWGKLKSGVGWISLGEKYVTKI